MADEDDEIILSELSDEDLVPQVHDDLYDGLRDEVVEAVNILLSRGWTPYDVLTKALVEGMRIVGIDFRDGILFVPEVLLAADSMKAGMAILKPLLAETGAPLARGEVGEVWARGANVMAGYWNNPQATAAATPTLSTKIYWLFSSCPRTDSTMDCGCFEKLNYLQI